MSVSNAINCDDDSRFETALSLLEDMIQLMPFDERDPYLQAVSRCPEVVRRDTDPLDFLRFESFDILKAAKLLLKYWELRIDLFGERAFRPMFDLSGGGVMDEELIGIVKTGGMAILPKDRNGDLVVHIDTRRAGKIFFDLTQHRGQAFCFWFFDYIRYRLKQDFDASAGIVMIQRLEAVPKLIVKNCVAKMIKEAMPYQAKVMRAVIVADKLEQKLWTQAFFPKLKETLSEKLFAFDEVTAHVYNSDTDMKLELLSFGLSEKGIPPSLGGTWSYEDFTKDVEKLQGMSSSVEAPPHRSCDWIERWQQYENTLPKEKCIFPLDNALMSIPFEDRVSYTQALKQVPDLVKEESFQGKFFQFYNFDEAKAASELARLWTLRERLFLDRAYLHMNQLGTGSLSKPDTQTLHTGFLMMLPNDSDGNFVFAYEPSRATGFTFASQRRCLFYMMFLALKDPKREKSVVKFLCHLTREESSKKKSKLTFVDILKVFPIETSDFHVVLETEGSQDINYKEAVASKMSTLFGVQLDKTVFHEANPDMDSCDIYLCLSKYGFSEHDVPPFFYGSFTDESFLIWQDEMIASEAISRSKTDCSMVNELKKSEESEEDIPLFTRFRKRGNDVEIQSTSPFSLPSKKSIGGHIESQQGLAPTAPSALHSAGTASLCDPYVLQPTDIPYLYHHPSPFATNNYHLGQQNNYYTANQQVYPQHRSFAMPKEGAFNGDNIDDVNPVITDSAEKTSAYRRTLADYWRMQMKGDTR